jgi:Arc/MetJ-type ribon-helix-helix transcriptional regulator
VEEASSVSVADFERMTKEEVIAWFDSTDDLSPLLARTTPAAEPAVRVGADTPMLLASIRLPVSMIETIDSLAEAQGVRRSEVIRAALASYIDQQTAPVTDDEAVRALDVLRRIVADRATQRPAAA